MPSSELRAVPQDFAQLKLAPGFLVGLNVLDDSDFAGTFRIDEQGALPYLFRHCSCCGRNRLGGEQIEELPGGGTDYERSPGYADRDGVHGA